MSTERPSKRIRPSPPGELPYPDPPPSSPTTSRRTLIPPVYKYHYFQMGTKHPVQKRLQWHCVPVTPEKIIPEKYL